MSRVVIYIYTVFHHRHEFAKVVDSEIDVTRSHLVINCVPDTQSRGLVTRGLATASGNLQLRLMSKPEHVATDTTVVALGTTVYCTSCAC